MPLQAASKVQLALEDQSLAKLAAEAAAKGSGAEGGGGGAGAEEDDAQWDGPQYVKVMADFTANVWEIKVAVGKKVAKVSEEQAEEGKGEEEEEDQRRRRRRPCAPEGQAVCLCPLAAWSASTQCAAPAAAAAG